MFDWIKKWYAFFTRAKDVVIVPKVEDPKVVPFAKDSIGVDISHHNKVTDMKLVASAVDFIYMKATEGASFVSKVYVERAKQLNEIGIPWGAYHYYRTNVGAMAQAKHFLKYIDVKSGLPPVLDVESINNIFDHTVHTEDLLTILEAIEKATGIVPILYTNYYFSRDHIKPDERFAKYPLWIAWYREDFAGVKIPSPWIEPKLWQFTSSGKVNGIQGRVDINKVMS